MTQRSTRRQADIAGDRRRAAEREQARRDEQNLARAARQARPRSHVDDFPGGDLPSGPISEVLERIETEDGPGSVMTFERMLGSVIGKDETLLGLD